MHPHLLRALDSAVAHFRADPRCLGMSLHGSIGRGETDAYSDIDVSALIQDEHYESVKGGMRTACERLFGPIVIWLPEGEQPNYCNFAFLFEHGDELLLTDFEVISQSLYLARNRAPDRILWDRTGVLGQVAAREHPSCAVADQRVLHLIDTYWVYAYLDGKYWRRNDLYRLLYIQQTLLQHHIRLVNVMHRALEGHWWAADAARLPERDQRRLRAYFSLATPSAAARSLARGLDLFAEDALAVCASRGLGYPASREQAVRRHLRAMGVPLPLPGERG